MRGTLAVCNFESRATGIIPAYAGNTQRNRGKRLDRWDHPRVCGEHFTVTIPEAFNSGSSPRMRGTHRLLGIMYSFIRIIPAYAGNT